jgi:hypothetical protein
MAVFLKQGVMGKLVDEARRGLGRVAAAFEANGEDLLITSIREGTHSAASLHYMGRAFDFRYPVGTWALDLEDVLGPGWDVVFYEGHVHAEFDPK